MNRKQLTIDDYLTSSGSYPDRAKSPEVTLEVADNARELLKRVNALLDELPSHPVPKVSSGFRTSEVNAATPNSAKRSAHMSGRAIDLMDDEHQTLGHAIYGMGNGDLLKKHNLMMEDLASTKGNMTNWIHLDTVPRTDRRDRVFKP